MLNTRRIIRAKLPTYLKDRKAWRRQILENVRSAAKLGGVEYEADDLLEVEVVLYLTRGKRHDIHDVDNRLKDILDALQEDFAGRTVGGTVSSRMTTRSAERLWRNARHRRYSS